MRIKLHKLKKKSPLFTYLCFKSSLSENSIPAFLIANCTIIRTFTCNLLLAQFPHIRLSVGLAIRNTLLPSALCLYQETMIETSLC